MQKETLKLFWHYSKPYAMRRNIALTFVILATIVESYAAPYILALFIDRLQQGNVTLDNSWQLIALYAATLLVSTVILWRITLWATWSFEVMSQRSLAGDVLGKLTDQSLSFHANRFGGSLISQTSKLVGSLERFWDTVIWNFSPIIIGVVTATIVLGFIYWPAAVFLFVMSVLFTISVFFGSRFMLERNKQDVAAYTAMTGYIADIVTNIQTVKTFGSEADEKRETLKRADTWLEKSLFSMRGFLSISTLWSTLIVIAYVGVLVFAVLASESGTVSIGTIFLIITYSATVIRHLWGINGVMRNYNRIMGDAHDMVEILTLDPAIRDVGTKKLTVPHGAVVFEDMSFAHDDGGGERVFKDFNLVIPAGQRVGIVGHSGSGKTTLTRLLLRFSDIDTGTISIDSNDIASVTQRSLRESIAYVAQEPMLFHRSLADNIAYGRPGATRKQIIDAAKKAHAYEFIKKLPEGLDTTVGERGVKLSGGQRQRIAIARAILKDASILVLDEATSALDSESEKLIQASLDTLMKNRTSIVIAHRLSTIAKLDRIIVLENGQIVEDGSHKELIAQQGVYASLWAHQSGGFIEE